MCFSRETGVQRLDLGRNKEREDSDRNSNSPRKKAGGWSVRKTSLTQQLCPELKETRRQAEKNRINKEEGTDTSSPH